MKVMKLFVFACVAAVLADEVLVEEDLVIRDEEGNPLRVEEIIVEKSIPNLPFKERDTLTVLRIQQDLIIPHGRPVPVDTSAAGYGETFSAWRQNTECRLNGLGHWYDVSLEQCVKICSDIDSCKYVSYPSDGIRGKCTWESTTSCESDAATERFFWDEGNMYEVFRESITITIMEVIEDGKVIEEVEVIEEGQCADITSDWADNNGWTCEQYGNYNGANWCGQYGRSPGPNNTNANEACCACGGGVKGEVIAEVEVIEEEPVMVLPVPTTEAPTETPVVTTEEPTEAPVVVVDTTPRISVWHGKVNQHTENGVWTTDPSGSSGWPLDWPRGGMILHPDEEERDLIKYCRKWYPETVTIQKREERETITFYTAGNRHAYVSTRDVFECQPGLARATAAPKADIGDRFGDSLKCNWRACFERCPGGCDQDCECKAEDEVVDMYRDCIHKRGVVMMGGCYGHKKFRHGSQCEVGKQGAACSPNILKCWDGNWVDANEYNLGNTEPAEVRCVGDKPAPQKPVAKYGDDHRHCLSMNKKSCRKMKRNCRWNDKSRVCKPLTQKSWSKKDLKKRCAKRVAKGDCRKDPICRWTGRTKRCELNDKETGGKW